MLLRDAFVIDIAADDRNLVLSYGPCQVRTVMALYLNCTQITILGCQ